MKSSSQQDHSAPFPRTPKRALPGISWRNAVTVTLLASGALLPVHAARKEPAFKVTATATQGPIVKIEGRIGFDYTAYDVADNTTFDLTEMYSTSRDDHPTATAFVAGEQQTPPKNLRVLGGVIHVRRQAAMNAK